MTTPSLESIVRHLIQLRKTLSHSLTSGNLSVDRFNDATAQMRALDRELLGLGVKPTNTGKRTAPINSAAARTIRREAKRSQGNTLTQRMARK